MLLAIDVGNTETVIGLFGPDVPTAPDAMGFARASGERGLAYHWRISTVTERTPDELAMVLTQLLDLEGLDLRAAVTAIAIASSVPSVTTQLRRMANRWFSDLDVTVIGPGTKSGMPILYDNPREVGPDRIADAVGAYDLYPGPSIVVDLGTATTSAGPLRPGARSRSTRSTRTRRRCVRSNYLNRARSLAARCLNPSSPACSTASPRRWTAWSSAY